MRQNDDHSIRCRIPVEKRVRAEVLIASGKDPSLIVVGTADEPAERSLAFLDRSDGTEELIHARRRQDAPRAQRLVPSKEVMSRRKDALAAPSGNRKAGRRLAMSRSH